MNSGDNLWFSALQLSLLATAHAIKFPRNEKNARIKARLLNWESREVECQGGKGGVRTEFKPPKDMQESIHQFLKDKPDFLNTGRKKSNKDKPSKKPYPTSTATHLVTGTQKHTRLTTYEHSCNQIRVNNFVTVPKYDLPLTTGGRDLAIHSAQVVDHLAFKKEWLEEMSISTNCLALIAVKDDSMEPTLRSNDLILTDTNSSHIENNSIYVLRLDNELIVKRIQRKVNGAVIVKSDNPVYGEEEFDAVSAQALPVVGKVIWYGRKI